MGGGGDLRQKQQSVGKQPLVFEELFFVTRPHFLVLKRQKLGVVGNGRSSERRVGKLRELKYKMVNSKMGHMGNAGCPRRGAEFPRAWGC